MKHFKTQRVADLKVGDVFYWTDEKISAISQIAHTSFYLIYVLSKDGKSLSVKEQHGNLNVSVLIKQTKQR